MNTLGVGIIGTGWVAGSHIEAFEADPRTAVRAIVSRDKERAHAKTEKHGLPRLTTCTSAKPSPPRGPASTCC